MTDIMESYSSFPTARRHSWYAGWGKSLFKRDFSNYSPIVITDKARYNRLLLAISLLLIDCMTVSLAVSHVLKLMPCTDDVAAIAQISFIGSGRNLLYF